MRNFKTENISDQVLVLKTQEGEIKLSLKDIIHIEGDRNYSYIHTVGNMKKLSSKTLSDLEDLLNDKNYFGCHKSRIINAVHILSLPNSTIVKLTEGKEIPIARRKKEEFKTWFDGYKTKP